jgi:hypothetical protein
MLSSGSLKIFYRCCLCHSYGVTKASCFRFTTEYSLISLACFIQPLCFIFPLWTPSSPYLYCTNLLDRTVLLHFRASPQSKAYSKYCHSPPAAGAPTLALGAPAANKNMNLGLCGQQWHSLFSEECI